MHAMRSAELAMHEYGQMTAYEPSLKTARNPKLRPCLYIFRQLN